MAIRNNIVAEASELVRRLDNKSTTARRAGQRRIEKGTEVMAGIARDFAPVDEGDLEAAIKTRKVREGRRNVFEIYVDESMPGSNGADSVADYAMIMHERDYELGPKSQEKDLAIGGNGAGFLFGGKVGPFYMDRAVEVYSAKLQRQVRDAISRGLK